MAVNISGLNFILPTAYCRLPTPLFIKGQIFTQVIKTPYLHIYGTVNNPIFACYTNRMYNYPLMKRIPLSVVFLLFAGTYAGAQNYKQYTIFIYSFTRYIQWPDAYNQGDFEILVMGDSPLLEELKAMAQQKKIGDRAIKVTRIGSASEIRKCNILFVPAAYSDKLSDILQKINTQSTLVITEQTGLGAMGSCINFITKEGKLAFELNQTALTKQNLKASIELTRLATII